MQPTDTALSHARARRGFNLVEAAIVLGVVGLVIGGIWVAAVKIKDEFKKSELQNSIALIVNGIKNIMPIQMWPSTGTGPTTIGINIGNVVINGGLAPRQMIKNGALINPISGKSLVVAILQPPTYPQHTIYITASGMNETQTNATMQALIQGQKSIVTYAYCTENESTHWVYNPPNTTPWPPDCPANSSKAVVYYNMSEGLN